MDISIVIPVFNEEKNAPLVYAQIKEVLSGDGRNYEIIFVDDGSTDRGAAIIKELQLHDGRIRLISFDKNYGQTSALDAGLRNAEENTLLR